MKDEMPKSDVNKEYYIANQERQVRVVLDYKIKPKYSQYLKIFPWLFAKGRDLKY